MAMQVARAWRSSLLHLATVVPLRRKHYMAGNNLDGMVIAIDGAVMMK
jgi:hypothetical protein